MLDALVGAVVMVVAATSLLYSVEVSQKAIGNAGQDPLSDSEIMALKAVGLNSSSDQGKFLKLNQKWKYWAAL